MFRAFSKSESLSVLSAWTGLAGKRRLVVMLYYLGEPCGSGSHVLGYGSEHFDEGPLLDYRQRFPG